MNIQKRRLFLKSALAAGVAAAAGLAVSGRALAADGWSAGAFEAKTANDALSDYFGKATAAASDAITISAPPIAENGALVQIGISTDMPDVESIALVVEKNSAPLAAVYELGPNTMANVTTRVKMGKTSDVVAVVKAGGKLYEARQEVKVTIGGCGG